MIKLKNVTKTFGNNTAVRNLNLEIGSGECFVLLGPNGAGKTTTVKMIVGLIKPTEGDVYINGQNLLTDYQKAKSCIAYIPDVPYLYDKLTGWEFLNFISKLFNVPNNEIDQRINHMLNIFDLKKYENRLIEEYSHGIRQRLVICAALIHDPKIIVVDEPMVALDPCAIRLVKNILKEKIKNGVTIFMSTHTLSIASEMATRIAVIHNGRIISIKTKEELMKITPTWNDLENEFLKITSEEK